MNKKVFGRKLSRSRPAREALFASLAQSLIKNGSIITTRAKAKAVIGSVEKMVTLAKKGGVSAQRKVMSNLDNKREAAEVLFHKVAKAFTNKNSGFIRLISLPRRVGDNAQMVKMEWTEKVETESPQKSKSMSKSVEKQAEAKTGIKKTAKKS